MVLKPRVCGRRSLKDILFKKRMERQLAAARGLGPMGDLMPGEGGEGGIPTAGSKVRPSTNNLKASLGVNDYEWGA